ncbi:transposase, partial [Streptomyces phaeochromogenes]|uniref:transposase n=1 Tax=Streptomyces phaeochromogenes TaxID=1923 RepID=UPI0036ABA412
LRGARDLSVHSGHPATTTGASDRLTAHRGINLNTHRAAGMRKYAPDHEWLTIIQLPSYSPDLNPVEGIWSWLRRGPMANTAFTDPYHLTRTLRRGLAHIQRHPELIDGCLTETGLTLASDPPKPIRKNQ